MKKLNLLLLALLLGMAGAAHAVDRSFNIPKSGNSGVADWDAKFAGVEKCILANSTTPALAVDVNGSTITAGLLRWVIRPASATAGVYLEFRDTSTANSTTTKLIPWIIPMSSGVGAGSLISAPNQIERFDPPIPFYNGLSFNLVPLNTAVTTGAEFSFGVSPRRAADR